MTTKKYTNQLRNKEKKNIIKDFFQITQENEERNNKNRQHQLMSKTELLIQYTLFFRKNIVYKNIEA